MFQGQSKEALKTFVMLSDAPSAVFVVLVRTLRDGSVDILDRLVGSYIQVVVLVQWGSCVP